MTRDQSKECSCCGGKGCLANTSYSELHKTTMMTSSILRKGCLANTPYLELHVKTMMKMAVKKRLEFELKFGDSNFILP